MAVFVFVFVVVVVSEPVMRFLVSSAEAGVPHVSVRASLRKGVDDHRVATSRMPTQ
jgi:hypothetical protein